MTTSSGSKRTLKQQPTPYDIVATWSAIGMSTMAWYLGATLTVSAMDPQDTLSPNEEDDGDDGHSDDLPLSSGVSWIASASNTAPGETAWCYIQ